MDMKNILLGALAIPLVLTANLASAESLKPGQHIERPSCDSKCFNAIEKALKSSNYETKTAAIYKLGKVGTPRAVRLLIPILNENFGGYRKGRDFSTPNFDMAAADSLRFALPHVWEKMLEDSHGKGVVLIPAWKAWWEQNAPTFPK
jgi:hypothetical protein